MYFAYIDESGDTGLAGSQTYALGCVLVEGAAWPGTFDRVIDFRRNVRDVFGVPVRAEIKANYLLRNGGPFRALALSESARFAIYRQAMRLHAKLDFKTFAIVVDKAVLAATNPARQPDDLAWEYLLQRLERFTTYGNTWAMIVHDEGNAKAVRALARKSRRAGGAGSIGGGGFLKRPFSRLLDDPVPRDSSQSYFVQFERNGLRGSQGSDLPNRTTQFNLDLLQVAANAPDLRLDTRR